MMLAAAASIIAPTVTAQAFTYLPDAPTGVKVTAVSNSSFTVSLNKAKYATSYRLIATTVKGDVYWGTLGTTVRGREQATASKPQITIKGLPYTAAPYWFRVAAINGSRIRWWASYASVSLRPTTPAGLAASNSGGFHLTWSHGSAAGYRIQQSASKSFSAPTTYTQSVNYGQFAPYRMSAGTAYWFRVQALNGTTASSWSTPIQATSSTGRSELRVGAYNVLSATFDGTAEGGTHVSPWAQRLPGVVSLIKAVAPAVMGIEEGGPCVTSKNVVMPSGSCQPDYRRQIDSIASLLGKPYALAATYAVPHVYGQDNDAYFSGSYIIYNTTVVTPIGTGGTFLLGNGRSAAYHQFEITATGAKFLFVDAHLIAWSGAKYDQERNTETSSMIEQANKVVASTGLPIVYGGDYNSYPGRKGSTDYPGIVMRAAQTYDAIQTAQTTSNTNYNSINEYERTPPQHGGSADHFYVTAGVGVGTWSQRLVLRNGQFVGVIPSDHNPIYSELYFPTPASTSTS